MKYRLGDICTITKGATGIMKAIPGDFTMVALGEVDRTHNEYQFDAKAAIIPLVSSTGHGHASMKRVKYQEGKFALGNILCAVIPKDENLVLAKYLHIYLHWNREELLVSQMKGMANVSLSLNKIADVEVIVPSVQKQKEIIELEQQLDAKEKEADKLFADQLTQLENLNQAILQEAVQGKLVPQDSNDEPATVLLKRIKTQKSKSGKKEKPLAPIKPEEIPFAIPESWVWCRLGEITNIVRGGSPRPAGDKTYYDGNIPFLKVGDLTEGHDIYLYKHTYTIKEAGLYKTRFVEANTLMLTNSGATLGYPKICTFPTTFNDGIAAFLDLPDDFDKVYLFYFLKSLTGWFLKVASRGQGQPNLNTDIIGFTLLPIPPREEQKRIVAEIERQLEKTKQLKEHIRANQQATEQLLKALLHGAFEVEEKKEETKAVPVIEFKPTNVDYYKRSLLAAELVWQLHKEPTLGHLKLQKLIYLCQKTTEMQLPTNFLRQAMGPYDPQLMRSIDKQLKEHKWFEYQPSEILKYKPLEKAGQHKADFEKFFSEEQSGIQYIINKFKSSLSSKIEIVATLYSCLENMLSEKLIFSEGLLLERFYDWSDEKHKFNEDDVKQAFARMIQTGIIPKGFNM